MSDVSKATVFNVTDRRIQISSDGRTLKGRASTEADTSDEVLTSALARGEVVLLSHQQVTQKPEEKAEEKPVASHVSEAEAGPDNDEAEAEQDGEAAGQAQEDVSQAEEEAEASEEETKIKKSARAKVAKEN